MLGYKVGELSPHISSWEPLCHPDDLQEARRRLQEHFEGKTPIYEFEHRLRHKDGHWVWILGRARVVEFDADGEPLRMVGTNVNITKRKEAEQWLHLIKFCFENAPEAIFWINPDGRTDYVNL